MLYPPLLLPPLLHLPLLLGLVLTIRLDQLVRLEIDCITKNRQDYTKSGWPAFIPGLGSKGRKTFLRR